MNVGVFAVFVALAIKDHTQGATLKSGHESGIYTFAGSADGAQCEFPFLYDGTEYTECTQRGHNQPWCATTYDYEQDIMWGNCIFPNDTRTFTSGGNSNGRPCVFPFDYKRNTYTACTMVGHKYFWCATTDDYSTDKKWGNCILVNATTTSPPTIPTTEGGEEPTPPPGGDTIYTTGGKSNGSACVFPFVYKNKNYTECTKDGHTKKWCATTDNFEEDGIWGNCILTETTCQYDSYYQFTSPSGTIYSPGYPGEYPVNTICLWKIVAPVDSNVQLTLRSFDIELADTCHEKDFLKISDSSSEVELCSRLHSGSFYSDYNVMYIIFVSNHNITNEGFVLDYVIEDLCESQKIIREPTGTLATPGFNSFEEGLYNNDMNCHWKFEAGSGQVVVITFIRIDIEFEDGKTGRTCYDELVIYDGDSSESQMIELICGDKINDYTLKSTGPYMYMTFSTDDSVAGNGFEFTWEFVDKENTDTEIVSNGDGCSGSPSELTGSSGSFASPLTDSNTYPAPAHCEYVITVSDGMVAVVEFNSFKLEDGGSECLSDYVMIYDGVSSGGTFGGTLLGKYCGTNYPPKVRSTSNSLFVVFHSDETVGADGFTASYSEVESVSEGECGVPNIEPSWRELLNSRIISGSGAVANSFPWQVRMWAYWKGDLVDICAGSIINNEWVLTAAHCVEWNNIQANQMLISAGDHSMTVDEPTQVIKTFTVIKHENYNDENYDNDIALLRLDVPLEYNFAIRPVCLPTEHVDVGVTCIVSGWGATKGTAEHDYTLNQVDIDIVDTATCNQEDWYNGKILETMFCAGYADGVKDSCQGDSGGPVVCENDDVYTLYGIVSWGRGCAEKKLPGVYTKVNYFLDWIIAQISTAEETP